MRKNVIHSNVLYSNLSYLTVIHILFRYYLNRQREHYIIFRFIILILVIYKNVQCRDIIRIPIIAINPIRAGLGAIYAHPPPPLDRNDIKQVTAHNTIIVYSIIVKDSDYPYNDYPYSDYPSTWYVFSMYPHSSLQHYISCFLFYNSSLYFII